MTNQAMDVFQESGDRYAKYCNSLASNLSDQLKPVIRDLPNPIGKVKIPSPDQFESFHETVVTLDDERENLIGAIEWCSSSQQHELLVNLVDNLLYYFWMGCYWDDLELCLSLGLQSARVIDDVLSQVAYLDTRGRLRETHGDFLEAENCFITARTILQNRNDQEGEAKMNYRLAGIYANRGRYNDAIDYYLLALMSFCASERYLAVDLGSLNPKVSWIVFVLVPLLI